MTVLNDKIDAIEKLSKISRDMSTTTTDINDLLKKIEERLGEMKLGVSAWANTSVDISNSEDQISRYRIGYCKFKNEEWRLVSQRIIEGDDRGGRIMPLLFSKRIIRMEACDVMDELLEALIDKSSKFLNDLIEVKEKIEKSESFKMISEEKEG